MKPLGEKKERIIGRPGWEAKFPEFADAANEGPVDTQLEGPRQGEIPWTTPPESSHLAGFRYLDARENTTEARLIRKFLSGRSELQVRFKPSGKRGASQYTYYFSDHEQGRHVFEMMKAAESPGEIVHSELILKRVPYDNTVRG